MRVNLHRKTLRANARLTALAGVTLSAAATLAAPPAAEAADATAIEGDRMEFTVTIGSPATGMSVRYRYRTDDNSAIEGRDYVATTGIVYFPPGVTRQTVSVDTLNDHEPEDSESFKLEFYERRYNAPWLGMPGWIELQQTFPGVPGSMTLTGEIQDDD